MRKHAASPERQLLLQMLDEAYERKAWHGPTLRGSLRGVSVEQALWRPGEGRHNVWEIALHAAYWKFVVRRRLLRERRSTFPRPGRNWFVPEETTEEQWREDLAMLDATHHMLRAVIEDFPNSHLVERARLIYGVAAHDVYHTGQIQMIKKLKC